MKTNVDMLWYLFSFLFLDPNTLKLSLTDRVRTHFYIRIIENPDINDLRRFHYLFTGTYSSYSCNYWLRFTLQILPFSCTLMYYYTDIIYGSTVYSKMCTYCLHYGLQFYSCGQDLKIVWLFLSANISVQRF